MKIAIIGSGISGLSVAHQLRGQADITLYEAGDYFGGHTHTVDVTLPDASGAPVTHGVDTGFLVFNERTYPHLIRLLADLGVETAQSDMSFSVQVPGALGGSGGGRTLEWSGTNLSTVFAQRTNLVNPRFLGMLRDLLRFNKLCTRIAQAQADAALMQPLGDFLKQHRFGDAFRDWYFLPMLGCIWSCPTDQMLQFPVATMIRFCHNHGLIQVSNRPQWWTVSGGARHYVDKIVAGIADKRLSTPVRRIERDAAGVRVVTDGRVEHFDQVVLATHSDSRWRCWPSPRSRSVPCWAPSATKPTAPCCTPTPRCCPHAAPPGLRGTTSAPNKRAANRPACACTTSSTNCNPCRLPSPWWCRSTRCATLHPSR